MSRYDARFAAMAEILESFITIRLPADYKPTGTPMPDIEPNPARKDFDLFAILERAIKNADSAHDLVMLSAEYRALIRDNEDWLKNA